MKKRTYDFSSLPGKNATVTKQQIIESQKICARKEGQWVYSKAVR